MAWYFPPNQFIASEVLDIDDFNGNLAAVHRELGGELNEQNFTTACLKDAEAKWATDIALEFSLTRTERDPHDLAAVVSVPVTMTWTPVDTRTVGATIGGKALIIYSLQMTNPTAATRQPGQNFCIEVDGTPYLDSLIGSGDQTNDWIEHGAFKFEGAGGVSADQATGPGFKGDYRPYVCELVTYLPPGDHTVRLLSRNIDTCDGTIYQKVASVEGIVMLMYS